MPGEMKGHFLKKIPVTGATFYLTLTLYPDSMLGAAAF